MRRRTMRSPGPRAIALRSVAAAALFAVAITAPTRATAAEWNCADKDRRVLEQSQPLNIGQLKFQLLDYWYCGGYEKELSARVEEAKIYIQLRAKQVEKPAIVLDIDETSLSNWPRIEQDDFGYIAEGLCTLKPQEPCGARDWELRHVAPAIKPTLALFNAAKQWGAAVFFVTGRRDRAELREATVNNLRAVGYDGWNDLMLRPVDDSSASASVFKTAARKTIAARGFVIIANMGDQQSDLDGGYAEQKFKLPNPFYFIP